MKLKIWFISFLLVAAAHASSKCATALEVRTEMELSADYIGLNQENAKEEIILPKGEKVSVNAVLLLTKERKFKCEYSTDEVTVKSPHYTWTSEKPVKAILNLKKEQAHLSVGPFSPLRTIDNTLYEGSPLHVSAFEDRMEDTLWIFQGDLAYFNYSDGHQFYGKGEVILQGD